VLIGLQNGFAGPVWCCDNGNSKSKREKQQRQQQREKVFAESNTASPREERREKREALHSPRARPCTRRPQTVLRASIRRLPRASFCASLALAFDTQISSASRKTGRKYSTTGNNRGLQL